MIAIDTNVLARYYVDDPTDVEAVRQRRIATQFLNSREDVYVSLDVILEFVWLIESHYRFGRDESLATLQHLMGITHVSIERFDVLEHAIDLSRQGLEFADALHLACAADCDEFATFDDRGFARKAAKLGVSPPVRVLR